MSPAVAEETRAASSIPAPPPPGAKHGRISEVAGHLRMSRGALNALRRADPTFPKPFMLGDQPTWVMAEVDAWIAQQPRGGWSKRGGLRERSLKRPRRRR